MFHFLQIQGFSLPSTSPAPAVERTPEGRALGHIPGWRLLIDPDYIDNGRALERKGGALTANENDPQETTTLAGQTAFDLSEGAREIIPPQPFNPTEWSVFAVARPQTSGVYQRIVAPRGPATITVPTVRFGYSSNGQTFTATEYNGGETTISYAPTQPYVGRTVLSILTFSTRDGIRYFENGQIAQHNDQYKKALEGGYLADEWVFFWGLRGAAGMCGVLDIDLGWPEHAGYRRAIERFLMQKYGIA